MTEHHIVKKKKGNMWKFVSGILFVLLLIVSFTPRGGSGLKEAEAKELVLEYVNNNLLRPGMTANVGSFEEVNGLYKLKLSIEGQEFDSYMTKDGSLLFPSVVDMTKEVEQPPAQPDVQPPVPEAELDVTDLLDDDAVKGDENAPVTIVEFSDYECPFCARFYKETYSQIVEEYIDTGKVKLIFRDFPLSFHRNAQKAGEAAECAGEQGKYYEMHDKLFESGVSGGVDTFKQYAKDIGLTAADFDDCLDSGEMAQEVQKDMADGQAAGISGTPGFIINGRKISGAQPFSVFQAAIEAELSN